MGIYLGDTNLVGGSGGGGGLGNLTLLGTADSHNNGTSSNYLQLDLQDYNWIYIASITGGSSPQAETMLYLKERIPSGMYYRYSIGSSGYFVYLRLVSNRYLNIYITGSSSYTSYAYVYGLS